MTFGNNSARNEDVLEYLDTVAIISESDAHGNITYVNSLFEFITGYSKKELIGKNHSIVNSGFHPPEFFKNLWSTIKNKKVWRGDILNKKKNGDLYWVDSTIFPVLDIQNEITGFISVRYDITERVRLKEAEIAQYRLRSLGESTAQILHDIMNPLMLIDSTLKIIHKKIDDSIPYDQQDLLKRVLKMESSSKRIGEICRSMQMLMHGTFEQKILELSTEVEAAFGYLTEKFQNKQVKFDISLLDKPEDLRINGNSVQIQQVIINLVNNSIDAIEGSMNPWVKVSLENLGPEVRLSVIDSGLGIDPKIQVKIWDAMFTTKDLYKGTGLGLGICKKIVESLKGRIEINNDSPNTRFDVYLPKLL